MYILLDENNYITAMSEKTQITGAIELDLPQDFNIEKQSCYKIINNEFIFNNNKELDYDKNELRTKREPILKAFDIYKTNVLYGIEEETNKQDILNWYKDLLDLKQSSIDNIPNNINKYI